jgi:chemotaxis protein MotB
MADSKSAPAVIIRKRKIYHVHHGGAWKVAYADFVTALMALFVVLWLLTSSEQVKKAVASYFLDPGGKKTGQGTGLVGSGESMALSKQDLHGLKERLERELRKTPDFQKIKDHITFAVTGEGMRIELLETSNGVFFDSGNAQPTGAAVETITILANELGKLPNKLLVEGHTDATRYQGGTGYSNWELSTDRANEARRIMQEHGIRTDQVK